MAQQDGVRSFEQWVEAVDSLVIAKVGLSVHDMPDMMLRSEYETGESPEEFFATTVKWELVDLGFAVDLMDELEMPIAWADEMRAEVER